MRLFRLCLVRLQQFFQFSAILFVLGNLHFALSHALLSLAFSKAHLHVLRSLRSTPVLFSRMRVAKGSRFTWESEGRAVFA